MSGLDPGIARGVCMVLGLAVQKMSKGLDADEARMLADLLEGQAQVLRDAASHDQADAIAAAFDREADK
jgi:hypothetical protein